MRSLVSLLATILLAGCVPFGSEGVSVEVDQSPRGQRERNLEAVREIWAEQRLRSLLPGELDIVPESAYVQPTVPSSTEPATPLHVIPLDEPLPPPLPPVTIEPEQPRPNAPQRELKRRTPRQLSPDVDTMSPAGPSVPPYTVFAPSGSAYPGSIRCVPDAAGGQRCLTLP